MAKTIDAMFFIQNLHLMYNKPNLLKMNTEASFEEAFQQKMNKLLNGTMTSEEIVIKNMIDKLKVLFSWQNGGMTLDLLKNKIRDRVKHIKPRHS